jgi:hypothetical protein
MSKTSTSTAQVRREPVTGRVLAPPDAALVLFKAATALIVAAERQGFDDGYFYNMPQIEFMSEAECDAYHREFVVGEQERAQADAWGESPPKKRR